MVKLSYVTPRYAVGVESRSELCAVPAPWGADRQQAAPTVFGCDVLGPPPTLTDTCLYFCFLDHTNTHARAHTHTTLFRYPRTQCHRIT